MLSGVDFKRWPAGAQQARQKRHHIQQRVYIARKICPRVVTLRRLRFGTLLSLTDPPVDKGHLPPHALVGSLC